MSTMTTSAERDLRGGERVENNRRRIGAGFLFDDFDARAARPYFELLDGRGAKRVRGAEHHGRAFFLQAIGELADGGGFSGAVHADDEEHARRAGGCLADGRARHAAAGICRGRDEDFQDLPLQFLLQLLRVVNLVLVDLLAQRCEHFLGGAHADVRAQQRRFKLLQQLRINGPVAGQQLLDARGKLRARLADRLLEPVEKRGFRFSEK